MSFSLSLSFSLFFSSEQSFELTVSRDYLNHFYNVTFDDFAMPSIKDNIVFGNNAMGTRTSVCVWSTIARIAWTDSKWNKLVIATGKIGPWRFSTFRFILFEWPDYKHLSWNSPHLNFHSHPQWHWPHLMRVFFFNDNRSIIPLCYILLYFHVNWCLFNTFFIFNFSASPAVKSFHICNLLLLAAVVAYLMYEISQLVDLESNWCRMQF